jgi:hypothetical protein
MAGGKTGQPVSQESVPRSNKHRLSFAGGVLIQLNQLTFSSVSISLMHDIAGIGSAPQ